MDSPCVAAYLGRIGIQNSPAELPANEETLTLLMAAHNRHIPFENIDVVFNRMIKIALPKLQSKIIGGKRGGYCFELNSLFGALLQALGFDVTKLLSRVRINREEDDQTPLAHIVLAVAIRSSTYLCDIAFAGSQSIAPVLLGRDGVTQLLPEGKFRTTSQPGGYTMLERQRNGNWDALYNFREDEPALPCDIEVGNFYSCKYPSARFCNEFFISLRVRSEDGTADALHYILDNKYVVRRADGHATKVTLRNRAELLTLLGDRFGLITADIDLPGLTRFFCNPSGGKPNQSTTAATAAATTAATAAVTTAGGEPLAKRAQVQSQKK